MILGPHYHFSTGRTSKNRGKIYLCQNEEPFDALRGCCIEPAWRDAKGTQKILL